MLQAEFGWVEICIAGGEHIDDASYRAALVHAHNPDVGVKFSFSGVTIRQPPHLKRGLEFTDEAVRGTARELAKQFYRAIGGKS